MKITMNATCVPFPVPFGWLVDSRSSCDRKSNFRIFTKFWAEFKKVEKIEQHGKFWGWGWKWKWRNDRVDICRRGRKRGRRRGRGSCDTFSHHAIGTRYTETVSTCCTFYTIFFYVYRKLYRVHTAKIIIFMWTLFLFFFECDIFYFLFYNFKFLFNN